MTNKTVLVTGARGFLGQNLIPYLVQNNYFNIIALTKQQCDLRDEISVKNMFHHYRPEIVIHLAATCGGIGANMQSPGQFFYDNLSMGMNLIEQSRIFEVDKFILLSTICTYPKITPVPFKEENIWNGYPEETNAPYGIAKKSLGVMLEAYHKQYGLNGTILMPTNMTGEFDNFDLNTSHVIPALIQKVMKAKRDKEESIYCWGDGTPTRDFVYVGDVCEAIVKSIETNHPPTPINLGTGVETSISQLVELICQILEYDGNVIFEKEKPNGQPRRCLDSQKAFEILGWEAKTSLVESLKKTIKWYKDIK